MIKVKNSSKPDQPNQLKKDKQGPLWLRQQGKGFQSGINLILLVAVIQFVLQMAGLFTLASILAAAVVDSQPPSEQQLLLLGTFFVAQLLAAYGIQRLKLRLSLAVNDHFDQRLKTMLERQSLALIREHSVATWQSYFLNRIPALQSYFCDYLPQQRLAVIVPVIVLSVTLPLSWLVTLSLLISAPLIPLFMWIVGVGAASVHRQQFRAIERLSSLFLDRLNARELLHIYKRQAAERAFFEEASEDLKMRTMKVVSLAFLSSSVLDFFATIAIALVAVFVGFSLLGELGFGSWESGLTLQESLFLLLLTPLFFKELKTLGRYYHTKADAVGAAEDLQPLLVESENISAAPPLTQLPLRLDHWIVYSRQHQPLISARKLELHRGDRVLLRGTSGSGKSTLLEAVLGLRENSGEQGRAALPPESVAWLTQKPVILPTTVRENLCLGEEFSEQQLLSALADVELTAWVTSLKQGLDSPMGDYPPLSGGQRQRLAIARMLLFNKPVVFLDEPTANLASDQQQRITRLLEESFADKTLIWISHDRKPSSFFTEVWEISSAGEVAPVHEEKRLCCQSH